MGAELLAPLGFVYRSHAWHLDRDHEQLSFCPEDSKFGIAFAVKYLTLALFHKAVAVPPTFRFSPLKNNSSICPVRISPAILGSLIDRDFDLRIWDCPPAGRSPRHTHLPVYFGGPDHRVLADHRATRAENEDALLTFLKDDGIRDLSEAHALETLRDAFGAVAEHGKAWADHLPVETAYRLMSRYPVDGTSYIHDSWLPAYAKASGRPS